MQPGCSRSLSNIWGVVRERNVFRKICERLSMIHACATFIVTNGGSGIATQQLLQSHLCRAP